MAWPPERAAVHELPVRLTPELMRLRLELFVDDLDRSVDFYRRVLGFHLVRQDPSYASLCNGAVVLGLGLATDLPARRGVGVEVVLEVDDLEAAYALVRRAGVRPVEAPCERPWGLRDFRILDPDGYYLRVTDGEAECGPDRQD
jgi:catechol 2,3-dioxygenase-like lactoylglutathione lyase family enzyme